MGLNKGKEIILQIQNVAYIKNHLGTDLWVQVSGHKYMNEADTAFWCGFVWVFKRGISEYWFE